MRRALALLPLLAACNPPLQYTGDLLLGNLNLIAVYDHSNCPFDVYPDGGLTPVDGGLDRSPLSMNIQAQASFSTSRRYLYLNVNGADRQGPMDGGIFSVDAVAQRQIRTCGPAQLDENLTGQFYGLPQPLAPDGGCPSLTGPGLFADGGLWPLAGAALADGGALDGGPSLCFTPLGLLPGATLTDAFVGVDAGLDAGPLCGAPSPPDAGLPACATVYQLSGVLTP